LSTYTHIHTQTRTYYNIYKNNKYKIIKITGKGFINATSTCAQSSKR